MSFEQAISTGYATDGGLYVPEQLPRVDSAELEQLAVLSFPELAEAIFRKFISAEEVQPKQHNYSSAPPHNRPLLQQATLIPTFIPYTLQSADSCSCSARCPTSLSAQLS